MESKPTRKIHDFVEVQELYAAALEALVRDEVMPKRAERAMKERKDYEEDVSRPGKYEGERPYVPYFYEMYLDTGCAYEDHGRTLEFVVDKEDAEMFPDLLEEGDHVFFYESENGFIIETDGPGDDDFEDANLDQDGPWGGDEDEEDEEDSED